jgi:choline-sulfatase
MNVVLLTVDCLRYDRCGFNGYYGETTPILDRLAESSYVFDRAYAPGPWTAASFPGILAGHHAPTIAYQDTLPRKAVPHGSPTIATQLGDDGYSTIATVTNPQLSAERNFDRGFDRFVNLKRESRPNSESTSEGTRDSAIDALKSTISDRISDEELLARLRGRSQLLNPHTVLFACRRLSMIRNAPDEWPTDRGETVVDRFTAELTDAADEQPFFAWTHLMDLHAPIHPALTTRDGSTARGLGRYLLADTVRASDGQPTRYSRLYDKALRYTDTQIGRVVDTLRSAGVWSDTVLIVTSDHGEAMGERGVNGHRNHYPYDELLHVPLLVRVPDSDEDGDRIDVPFSLSWLHELTAEVLDIEPMDLPAGSPSGTHLGDIDDGRLVVADSLTAFGHTVVVRDRQHKLIKHFDGWIPTDRTRRYEFMRHFGVRTTDFDSGVFDPLNATYRPLVDPCERIPRPEAAAPSDLHERATEIHTHADDLQRIDGQPDAETERMLRDVGYF